MGTVDAPAMPPTDRLLALLEPDPTLLARVLLAQLCGAYWVERKGAWWLHVQVGHTVMGARGCLLRLGIGATSNRSAFKDYGTPDPFTDPAAAWELETREHLYVMPPDPVLDPERWTVGHDQAKWIAKPNRKRAAVIAVLHKHADGPLSALIRSTLERLENAQ